MTPDISNNTVFALTILVITFSVLGTLTVMQEYDQVSSTQPQIGSETKAVMSINVPARDEQLSATQEAEVSISANKNGQGEQ